MRRFTILGFLPLALFAIGGTTECAAATPRLHAPSPAFSNVLIIALERWETFRTWINTLHAPSATAYPSGSKLKQSSSEISADCKPVET